MKESLLQSLSDINRRDFLKRSALASGVLAMPSFAIGQAGKSANGKLNVALVGVGGKGKGPTVACLAENVVALCDVDDSSVASGRAPNKDGSPNPFDAAVTEHERRGAKWYKDYRVMFEEVGDKLDAVIISIPDFMHYPVAMSAINLGINVYCEKPLTHTVSEARALAAAAKKKGIVSQMGNQGHSNEGTRLVREWIQAGVIGEVKEVHSWTNRPIGTWTAIHGTAKPKHGAKPPAVPVGLDWDLWQGISERREYDPSYLPFSWRGFTDYGCGALGDMACHIMDSPFWALDLGSPVEVSGSTTERTGYTFPKVNTVTFKFPKRGKMPAVTYKWYDGGMFPAVPRFLTGYDPFEGKEGKNGSLIIGDGMAIQTTTYSEMVKILPEKKFMEIRQARALPPKTIPRIKGEHLDEFFNAIKENRPASSDFSYAGPFTESILLGSIAEQTGRTMRFDGEQGKFIGDAEANKMLSKKYPDGWILS